MTASSKKKDVIVVYFKMVPQRDNRVKVCRAEHKVSEAAYLVGFRCHRALGALNKSRIITAKQPKS